MYVTRKASDRGYFDHGWLKTYHTFSFGDYYEPAQMGFGPLRVINEDTIEGGAGFPTHGHRDMEIITYPITGAIEHEDSTGSSGVIFPYEIQKMTAGKGIMHSEFNHLKDGPTHLLQIWIMPQIKGLGPSYEQKNFKEKIESNEPTLLVSPQGTDGSMKIHQDVFLWAKRSPKGSDWSLTLRPDRKYWVQVVKGEVLANGATLSAGDALAITGENQVSLISTSDSEVLFFDMTGAV